MRRVLIVGCGYIGQAAADLFHAAGHEVEGWTRTAESAAALAEKPYPVVAVDVTARDQVNSRPENFDAVFHCVSTRGGDAAAYRAAYFAGARNLIDRLIGATLFFISSTSVYAQRDGELVDEQSPTEPRHETGRVLRETEQLVLAHGGVVARVAGIYGPGRSALLNRFLRGEAMAGNDRYINQVHREDVAAALGLLLDRTVAPERIFNVADDHPMRLSECYDWLGRALHRSPPGATSTAPRKRGDSNKRVSNAKLRALGWAPRYRSFVEGMQHSVLPADPSLRR